MVLGMAAGTDPDDQDWEIVSREWWKTSFRSILWTYAGSLPPGPWMSLKKPPVDGLPSHPRPPHYHDLLYRTRHREWVQRVSQADLELSSNLPGVEGAEDVLRPYEVEVGVSLLIPSAEEGERALFTGSLSEEDLAATRSKWRDEVQELLGDVTASLSSSLEELVSASDSLKNKMWNLSLLDSPCSEVIDLTDSEASVESDPLPVTPRAGLTALPSIQHNGELISPHPSKPLNASAVSFIPSAPTPPPDSSSPSPDLQSLSPSYEFTFPSLHTDNPTASPAARRRSLLLEKDTDGFYHPIADSTTDGNSNNTAARSSTPRRASADLLPAFLSDNSMNRSRLRNTSRTREIVDRLRSGRWTGKKAQASGKTGKVSSEKLSPAPTESPEETVHEENVPEAPNPDNQVQVEDDGWIRGPFSSSTQDMDDGWITGPSVPTLNPVTPPRQVASKRGQKQHKHSASSTSSTTSFSPATPASHFGVSPHSTRFFSAVPIPSLVGVGAFPTAPATSVMAQAQAQYLQQVQMQLQAQQWQRQARQVYLGAQTFPQYPVAPGVMMPVPGQPMLYPAKGMGLMGVQW